MRIFSSVIALATVLFAFTTLFLFLADDKAAYTLLSRQKPIQPDKLTGLYDFSKTHAYFNNTPLSVPLYTEIEEYPVLGKTTLGKRIEVDLTRQRLFAYEGENLIYDFPVSSGLWTPTPKGVFKIWIKLRYTDMEGGSQLLGTYYNLPNVPYVMFFYNQQVEKKLGFAIHGVYWHNAFGRPLSHGCINLRPDDAKQLYYWADPDLKGYTSIQATEEENPGTEIIIYGDASIRI